jgi:hypothetical protein
MKIVEDNIEYTVMVNTHPDEDRFLMIVSLLNRRFWIVDLKLLSIQRNLPELESFYELKRHQCTKKSSQISFSSSQAVGYLHLAARLSRSDGIGS